MNIDVSINDECIIILHVIEELVSSENSSLIRRQAAKDSKFG
jgi:hypothetical protein